MRRLVIGLLRTISSNFAIFATAVRIFSKQESASSTAENRE